MTRAVGWHQDPEDPGLEFYWDGTEWNGTRQSEAPTPSATLMASTSPTVSRPSKAILAIALGVVLIVVAGAAGFVLKSQTSSDPGDWTVDGFANALQSRQVSCPDSGLSATLTSDDDLSDAASGAGTKLLGGRRCPDGFSYAIVADPTKVPAMKKHLDELVRTLNQVKVAIALGTDLTEGQKDLACLSKVQCTPYPLWLRGGNAVIITANSETADQLAARLSDMGISRIE